jgi:ribosomal protein S27AE
LIPRKTCSYTVQGGKPKTESQGRPSWLDPEESELMLMEASKCPKCGEEPSYLEHIEKWYCYECNSYLDGDVEDEETSAESDENTEEPVQANAESARCTCKTCGAEMEEDEEGHASCAVCAKEETVESAPHKNEAQNLLDEVVAEASQAPAHEPAPMPEPERVEVEITRTEVSVRTCPICGKPLKFIEKYQRHYCYGCKKYAPKERVEAAPAGAGPSERKTCPDCGRELKFIEKYKEHYCYTCKRYPLVKKKSQGTAINGPPKCPGCGKELKYIEKYQRHYCYACKKYAPKGTGGAVAKQAAEEKTCPICKGQMKFVSEYNEWYCYKCKKYSLRPNKPVLLF